MKMTIKKIVLIPFTLLFKLNSVLTIKILFFLKHRYRLNLKVSYTYNEKINWMKLNYRNELMPKCADKYTVRKYVEEKGLSHILNKIIWEGYDARKIPFDILPNQFIIKVTHGAGNNIICVDKGKLNRKKTINKLNKWLKQKYIPAYGEWFYGVVKPRIIIEELLIENGEESPIDYKLYYFNDINGKQDIGITAIHRGRKNGNLTKTIYDADWNVKKDVTFGDKPELNRVIKKPKQFEKLKEYTKILSEPFPHARVDFYIINNKVYFGEITFMTGAGFNKITPKSFDEQLGEWIRLPN